MTPIKQLIRQYYAYFNEDSLDSFLNLLHENVIHDINQGERQIGKPAFQAFMERMSRCYKEQIKHIVIMVDEDAQRAAAEFIVEGCYLATDTGLPPAHGQRYSLPGGAFFEVKDNKISRVTNYYNMNDWLLQVKRA